MKTLQLLTILAFAFILQNNAFAQYPNPAQNQPTVVNDDQYNPNQQVPPVTEQPANVTVPDWAPTYDNAPQTQYYYMPDIETYYDVWNQEFVYLQDGNWLFSRTLPPMYSWYNLHSGHVVVLDRNVHQPWRHHELYASHYPRYYNRVTYPANGNIHPHGFDENTQRPIYRAAVRNQEIVHEERKIQDHPQRSMPVEYRDRNVGQPVRVEQHMTRPGRR